MVGSGSTTNEGKQGKSEAGVLSMSKVTSWMQFWICAGLILWRRRGLDLRVSLLKSFPHSISNEPN